MDVLSNIRAAYRVLEDRVTTALRTQIGDFERLRVTQDDVLALRGAIGEVRITINDTQRYEIFTDLI